MDGVKLKFTKGALGRSLKRRSSATAAPAVCAAILETAMLDIMYDVPSQDNIKEVLVNEDTILNGATPIVVYAKDAATAGGQR
jgi:ATP-dependent Clp protease ATP-binding subunit ClpX